MKYEFEIKTGQKSWKMARIGNPFWESCRSRKLEKWVFGVNFGRKNRRWYSRDRAIFQFRSFSFIFLHFHSFSPFSWIFIDLRLEIITYHSLTFTPRVICFSTFTKGLGKSRSLQLRTTTTDRRYGHSLRCWCTIIASRRFVLWFWRCFESLFSSWSLHKPPCWNDCSHVVSRSSHAYLSQIPIGWSFRAFALLRFVSGWNSSPHLPNKKGKLL